MANSVQITKLVTPETPSCSETSHIESRVVCVPSVSQTTSKIPTVQRHGVAGDSSEQSLSLLAFSHMHQGREMEPDGPTPAKSTFCAICEVVTIHTYQQLPDPYQGGGRSKAEEIRSQVFKEQRGSWQRWGKNARLAAFKLESCALHQGPSCCSLDLPRRTRIFTPWRSSDRDHGLAPQRSPV